MKTTSNDELQTTFWKKKKELVQLANFDKIENKQLLFEIFTFDDLHSDAFKA